MMELIPTETLNAIAKEAREGDYLEARQLVEQELERRTEVILQLGSTATEYIVPIDPMEGLECEGCS